MIMIPCLGSLEFEIHHASVCIYHVFLIYLHARFLNHSTPRYEGADFNGPTSIVDCLTHCASSSASPQKCNAHSGLKASDRKKQRFAPHHGDGSDNCRTRCCVNMPGKEEASLVFRGGRACQILFGADIVIANE